MVYGCRLLLLIMIIAIALTGCGQTDPNDLSGAPSGFLFEDIPAADLARSSDVHVFIGDSLWEYIDGGAEVYHTYGFLDVATADYRSDAIELVIDIYRFNTSDGAYGLYSSIRPPVPNNLEIGVEGFITSTSADFVKGQYLCRLTAFAPSQNLAETMRATAEALGNALPGTTEPPKAFGLFPKDGAIPFSRRIYAESFLGHQSLSWVYARQYAPAGDTVTLFIIPDSVNAKFDRFQSTAEQTGAELLTATKLAFDDGKGIQFDHPYYGTVALGIVNMRLAGMIGVTEDNISFLNAWLESMDSPSPSE